MMNEDDYLDVLEDLFDVVQQMLWLLDDLEEKKEIFSSHELALIQFRAEIQRQITELS